MMTSALARHNDLRARFAPISLGLLDYKNYSNIYINYFIYLFEYSFGSNWMIHRFQRKISDIQRILESKKCLFRPGLVRPVTCHVVNVVISRGWEVHPGIRSMIWGRFKSILIFWQFANYLTILWRHPVLELISRKYGARNCDFLREWTIEIKEIWEDFYIKA